MKKLTKFEGVLANTEEEAVEICGMLDKAGFTWSNGQSYKEDIKFNFREDGQVYNPSKGTYCSRKWAKRLKLTVYSLKDLEQNIEPYNVLGYDDREIIDTDEFLL